MELNFTWLVSVAALVLFLPSVQLNKASGSRCLTLNDTEVKNFYVSHDLRNITVLTSSSVGHRLVSEMFVIFASQVLGYPLEIVVNDNLNNTLEHESQFANISSCSRQNCHDLDDKVSSADLKVPRGMLTLGVLLPPSYHVETWGLMDVGQLGPAPRYGWYVPTRLVNQSHHILEHWRSLRSKSKIEAIVPNSSHMEIILQNLKHKNGSYICTSIHCKDGIFEPPLCKRIRHSGDSSPECAALLTDFPVSTSLFDTTRIMDQIRDMKLLVKIYFLGSKLDSVIDTLENGQHGNASYMVLGFHPAALTTRYNYTQVKFPSCADPLYLRDDNANCMYSAKRMAKVVWKPVINSAPEIYNFLDAFSLTYTEYVNLLQQYNKAYSADNGKVDLNEVACQFMKQDYHGYRQGRKETFPWYEKWISNRQKQTIIHIGGIFPNTGTKYVAPELAPVALLAVHHINSNDSILRKHQLVLNVQDGQCEADVVMKRFIDILKTRDQKIFRSTVGMLGPACSDTVEPIAGVSKHFRTVVISYSAEGSISKDNSKEYPYFFRTIAENNQYKYVYLEIMRQLDWNKVGALTEDGEKYTNYMSDMQDEFQQKGIDFVINRKFPSRAIDMRLYLRDLRERGAKIIIGDFYVASARHVMCDALRMGMTQKEGYVWFLPGWFKQKWFDIDLLRHLRKKEVDDKQKKDDSREFGEKYISWNEDITVGELPNCTTAEMIDALNGHFLLEHSNFANENQTMQTDRSVGEWKSNVQDYLKMTFSKKTHSSVQKQVVTNQTQKTDLNKYSGYVYDAVWLYAYALDTLIKENNSYTQNLHSERSVSKFVEIIRKIDFKGVSGRVNFFNRQSRLSNIKIMQWYIVNITTPQGNITKYVHQVGEYEPNYYDTGNNTMGKLLFFHKEVIKWQTPDGNKPEINSKECGPLSALATRLGVECTIALTIVLCACFALVVIILAVISYSFKFRYDRKVRAAEERMKALGLLSPMSVIALDEWEIPRDRVVTNRKLGEGAFGTVYGGEAYFDDKEWVAVAVKTLKVGSTFEEKLDFLSEAEMMKRFDHKNIVKLLGVCTRNEPVYTVMEYMLYGDLKTYLLARRHLVNERNREEMDEVSNRRLTSMAHDVAKGLAYLADLKYVHRDLACRNCLVNSSRTVKLADFGMTRAMFEHDYYKFSRKGMLPVRWMSPESLVDGMFTPMSDIWSYGVLLYEMITFGSFPFQGLSNNQVLEHVKLGNTLNVPAGIKSQLATLLRSCWSRTPTKRPTAGEIVELLANNIRLISPCIDVPLASVQIERTDSLEMVPGGGGTLSAIGRLSKTDSVAPPYSNISNISGSEYSPMNGTTGMFSSPVREKSEGFPLMNNTEKEEGYEINYLVLSCEI